MTTRRVGARPTAPRLLAASAAVLVLVVACAPAPPSTTPQTGPGSAIERAVERRPVVLIPGWALGCISGGGEEWFEWIDAMRDRGYERVEWTMWDYDACQPNVDTAAELEVTIDQVLADTGATRVNVVAHSMGNLGVRWCLRFGGCATKIDHYVSLAGTNHGTLWADACALQFWSRACGDMRADGPFLAALNAGDETPGDVRYTTYSSWCDLVVVPYS